jgi:hypothetical protein
MYNASWKGGPESFLWIVGVHLDRIGASVSAGRKIGDDVLHLYALVAPVLARDGEFAGEWEKLKTKEKRFLIGMGLDPDDPAAIADSDAALPTSLNLERLTQINMALHRVGMYYAPRPPERSSADEDEEASEVEAEAIP